MQCKVFNAHVDDLETEINEWLTANNGVSLEKIVSVDVAGLQSGLAVFYVDLRIMYPKVSLEPEVQQVPSGQSLTCPECQKAMKIRANRTTGDLFWGCKCYPDCKGTRQFTDADKIQYGGELPESTTPSVPQHPCPSPPLPPSASPSASPPPSNKLYDDKGSIPF